MNTFPLWNLLRDAAIKAMLVLLAAGLLSLAMRRASAAMRHLVWTSAMVMTLLLPIGMAVLPSYRVALPVWRGTRSPLVQAMSPAATPSRIDREFEIEKKVTAGLVSPQQRFTLSIEQSSVRAPIQTAVSANPIVRPPAPWPRIALSIWLIGLVLVTGYWVIGLLAAEKMRRLTTCVEAGRLFDTFQDAQRQLGLKRTVQLRVGPDLAMPFTAGTWQPKVFLPQASGTWSDEQLESAMLHELAHVKRFDCAVQWLTNWACAVYWFNPLVWVAALRLRIERERACDDRVLHQGAAPASYAEHLLAVARALRGTGYWQTSAIAMARSSGLRQRVSDILDSHINRRLLSTRAIVTVAFTTLAALISLSCVQLGTSHASKPAQPVANDQPAGSPVVAPRSNSSPSAPTQVTSTQAANAAPTAIMQPARHELDAAKMRAQLEANDQLLKTYLEQLAAADNKVAELQAQGAGDQHPTMIAARHQVAVAQRNVKLRKEAIAIAVAGLLEQFPAATGPAGSGPKPPLSEIPSDVQRRPVHLTVLNNATGQPIEGARVDYPDVSNRITSTDARGHAVFDRSTTSFSVWCSGYINHRITWEPKDRSMPPPSEYTVRLDPYSPIGGKVVDDAGQPIQGANIEIYINGTGRHENNEFIETPWINRAVTTAADGTWHFERVPPHPARPIKVAVWDYKHLDSDFFFLKEYTPQSALHDKTATFVLHRGVFITGSAVDPFYGKPIAGAKVSFGEDQSASNKIPPLTTDDHGAFSLTVQPGTKLFLSVTKDGYKPEVKQQIVGDKPETWEFDLSPTSFVH